jgi:hypothetical protein
VSQEDPGRTVQTFIDLVQRHEQAFYTFVHNVHSKGQGLFDSLMGWIELFLSYARVGLQPLDLEFLLPAPGAERDRIMAEVDAVAQYHYRLKVAHEEKIRRRFRREAAAEEEAALLDSVMASLSLDEGAMGEAGELNDEEEEDGSDDDRWDEDDLLDGADAAHQAQERLADASEGVGHGSSNASRDPQVEAMKGGYSAKQGAIRGRGKLTTPVVEKNEGLAMLHAHSSNEGDEEKNKKRGLFHRHKKDGEASPRNSIDSGTPPVSAASSQQQPPHTATSARSGGGKGPSRGQRRRQEKKISDLMTHPDTKAIEELRPLFVEMVSQNRLWA